MTPTGSSRWPRVLPKPPDTPTTDPQTWLLLLTYCGTRYAGWQVQPDQPTIEAELETALQRLTGTFHKVQGCGRTDAGVHALNYPAHFLSHHNLPPERWKQALNGLLPPDIIVREVAAVPAGFHARHSSIAKRYGYLLHNAPQRHPFDAHQAWWVHKPLAVESMKEALNSLLGEQDFAAFRARGCSAPSSIRELRAAEIHPVINPWGNLLIELEANSFLQHMVRIIVGTCVEVGLGKRTPESIVDVLASRDRVHAGRTAPACGLYQLRVRYPQGLSPWSDQVFVSPFCRSS